MAEAWIGSVQGALENWSKLMTYQGDMAPCSDVIQGRNYAEGFWEGTKMSNSVGDSSDSSFEKDVLQSDKLVLVDFWAGWCAPCRMLAPTIEAVAETYSSSMRVLKVDVDNNPAVSERYGIRSIPTLILFKGGKEEERVV